MDLLKLRYFASVAGCDSMQKAAEELCVAQSTLSTAIKNLEAEMEVALFEKVGRRLKLTEAGEAFLDDTIDLLSKADQMTLRMKSYQQGVHNTVIIATEAPDFTLECADFIRAEHPDMSLIQYQPQRKDIKKLLLSEKIDFAITLFDDTDDNVESVLLLEEPMTLLADIEHPLSRHQNASLSEFEREAIVTLPLPFAFRILCENFLSMAGIKPFSVIEVPDMEVIPLRVRRDKAISLIPRSTFNFTKSYRATLSSIPLNERFVKRYVYLTALRYKKLSRDAANITESFRQYGEWAMAHESYPAIDIFD